jgi:hypothetical protein
LTTAPADAVYNRFGSRSAAPYSSAPGRALVLRSRFASTAAGKVLFRIRSKSIDLIRINAEAGGFG